MSQKQEDSEKQKNRNKEPRDNGCHCNHSTDLEKYLQQKERCNHKINQTATESKAPLLLCGPPLGQSGLFLKAEQEKLFQLHLCEAIMDIQ